MGTEGSVAQVVENNPKLDTVRRLAKALKVTVAELVE